MNRQQDVLQQIAGIAQSSRDFFVAVYPASKDAEVRSAFAYIGEVKSRLLAELSPWLTPGPELDPASDDTATQIAPSAIVAKMYLDARKAFRGDTPAASAGGLGFAEEQLLRLLERAFEESDSAELKQLLKSYHPQLIICREAMWRLRSRQAA